MRPKVGRESEATRRGGEELFSLPVMVPSPMLPARSTWVRTPETTPSPQQVPGGNREQGTVPQVAQDRPAPDLGYDPNAVATTAELTGASPSAAH
jgi:hypothetical protein